MLGIGSWTFARKIKVLLVLGLAVILVFAAHPVYRQAKTFRAIWLASQAMNLYEDEKIVAALQKAGVAYQLSPQNPKVLLLMARVYGQVNPDYALAFWKQLEERDLLHTDARLEFIRYGLLLRRMDLVQKNLAVLLQQDGQNEEVLLLAAEIAALGGNPEHAAAYARQVSERNPDQRRALLMLAGFLQSTGKAENQKEAHAILEELQNEKDIFSLRALIQLSTRNDLSRTEMEKLRLEIRSHPKAGEKEKLLADELRIRASPARRSEVLGEIQSFYLNKDPAERLEAARWMNRQRESARVLELLPLKDALSRQDLFLVWADAMALGKRWKELETVLEKEPVPLEGLLVTIFRARAAREQGDEARSQLYWTRALNSSGSRPEILWYMASYAEKLGTYDLAKAAYLRLTRITSVEKNAYIALIMMQQKQGDTRGLRDTYQRMLARFPHEKTAVNDLAYLNLLLGENMEEAGRTAERLVGEDPSMMAYRVTAALGSLRRHEAEEAYTYYATANLPDISVLNPSWQALYAAIRGALGHTQEARIIAGRLKNKQLLPEEKALILPYL